MDHLDLVSKEHDMGKFKIIAAVALVTVALTGAANAQSGPVSTACEGDIAKFCAGKGHGNRQTRTCLEENKDKVSSACKTALETTGGGAGKGRNRQ